MNYTINYRKDLAVMADRVQAKIDSGKYSPADWDLLQNIRKEQRVLQAMAVYDQKIRRPRKPASQQKKTFITSKLVLQ